MTWSWMWPLVKRVVPVSMQMRHIWKSDSHLLAWFQSFGLWCRPSFCVWNLHYSKTTTRDRLLLKSGNSQMDTDKFPGMSESRATKSGLMKGFMPLCASNQVSPHFHLSSAVFSTVCSQITPLALSAPTNLRLVDWCVRVGPMTDWLWKRIKQVLAAWSQTNKLPLLSTIKHHQAIVVKRLPPHWQWWVGAWAACSVHLLSPCCLRDLPHIRQIPHMLNQFQSAQHIQQRHTLGKWTLTQPTDHEIKV